MALVFLQSDAPAQPASATKPPRYSATTIRTYRTCPRKFWWAYVGGVDAPPSKAQSFGTNVHAHLEAWLKYGTPPPGGTPEGRTASAGLSLLPARPGAEGLHVEHPFSTPVGDVEVTGTIDFCQRFPGVAVLGDHKTTSDLKWRKGEADLRADEQANLYSWYLMTAWDVEMIRATWVYYQKSPPAAAKTDLAFYKEDVAGYMSETVLPAIEGMRELATERPGLRQVPGNLDECGAYGGCPYRERCSPQSRSLLTMSSKGATNMGVISQAASSPTTTKAGILAQAQALAAKYQATDVNPPAPTAREDAPEPNEYSEAQVKVLPKTAKQPKVAKAAKAEAAEAPPAAATKASPVSPGYNPQHNFWLFVGCTPTRGLTAPVVDLDVLCGPAQAEAAEAVGKAHYREAEFGQGSNALEASFAHWLEAHAVTGAVRVDTYSPAAKNVLGLLRAHAAFVVEKLA